MPTTSNHIALFLQTNRTISLTINIDRRDVIQFIIIQIKRRKRILSAISLPFPLSILDNSHDDDDNADNSWDREEDDDENGSSVAICDTWWTKNNPLVHVLLSTLLLLGNIWIEFIIAASNTFLETFEAVSLIITGDDTISAAISTGKGRVGLVIITACGSIGRKEC